MERLAKEDTLPGAQAFRLLSGRWTIGLLRELADGPLQPSDLEQRMPAASHSALMRGLRELAGAGAVLRERVSGTPPRAYYHLADGGHALLLIAAAAAELEPPGEHTLRLLADAGSRALVLALADGALRPIELDGCVSHFSRSASRRRLGRLLESGVVSRTQASRGEVRYELTQMARRLEAIVALAAAWERQQWGGSSPLGRPARPAGRRSPVTRPATPATPPKPAPRAVRSAHPSAAAAPP